jgi:hypothetical protein
VALALVPLLAPLLRVPMAGPAPVELAPEPDVEPVGVA